MLKVSTSAGRQNLENDKSLDIILGNSSIKKIGNLRFIE
uniref:Uncharacterized protein n=1 Tax=Candidatus Kentrum sp. MB TaxID=2138164 RepID=A0A450XJS0_9GAMM|nr:MAG: hypothetical protein BECKMB1821G_GA0114241_105020 [Candidatus Kentron sp. MB]